MMKGIKPKLFIVLVGTIVLISTYLIVVFSFWFYSRDRIYPGVTVAGISLAGKDQKEAENILREKASEWEKRYIILSAENEAQVLPTDLSVKFDFEGTIEKAIAKGSKNPFILGTRQDFPIIFTISVEETEKKIDEAATKSVKPVINSRVEKKNNEIMVVNGESGIRVNYAESAFRIKEAIGSLKNITPISLFKVPPTFTDKDLVAKMPEINRKSKDGILLNDGASKHNVAPEIVVSWVDLAQPENIHGKIFEGDNFYVPNKDDKEENLIFSEALVSGFLLDLSGKINASPVNAQLTIADGRASVFVPSKNGRSLDIEKSAKAIILALDKDEKNADLVVNTIKPEVNEESLNNLGITELISIGSSNFAGSPVNRRHNIKIGASRFNGVLIKPEEEFSFNKALGPVDASIGYLPELVIKENKTIPEYGGGMCQVSSTAFRAALNAGLPIISRTAHSYPVSYYKPYGVDATVYLPYPDLVFKNDTGKYILVQTRISGNNLYFDFYGTKPQRTVSFAGSESGAGAVYPVEKVTPYLYDQGARGNNSFTAIIYRLIYDSTGKLIKTNKFVSKYDSPDKYPH